MIRSSLSLCAFIALIACALASDLQAIEIRFQDGVTAGGTYTGTIDTTIRQGAAGTANGGLGTNTVNADTDDTGLTQGLIRFDNLFGAGPNQIPVGATISSATLRLRTVNESAADSMSLHEMLQAWSDATVFNNFNANTIGINIDNVEAKTTATVSAFDPVTNNVDIDLDVTSSLQGWALNPAQNLGWVVFPLSTNGWQFASSEEANTDFRPELIVNYLFAVPEPSSIALFSILGVVGVAAAGWCGRRRYSSR